MDWNHTLFALLLMGVFGVHHTVTGSYLEKVRLEDVKALTLYAGKMTTGRRSAPVPQLKCIKGCHAPEPRVVQCVNRGWDGSSVQWECKAQLSEEFELGAIEVICEGYDYADDPYILKGSCGLEYAIEPRQGYQGGGYDSDKNYGWKQEVYSKDKGSSFGNWLFLAACAIVIYGLYRTCIATGEHGEYTQRSTTDDDRPDDGMGPGAGPRMGWNVPGAGMGPGEPGYMPRQDSCGAGQRRSYWRNAGYGGGQGGGGFWTGIATGGLLGYMFGGNQNRGGYNAARRRRYGSSSSGLFSSSGSPSGSSTTHESTSFGGTRRR